MLPSGRPIKSEVASTLLRAMGTGHRRLGPSGVQPPAARCRIRVHRVASRVVRATSRLRNRVWPLGPTGASRRGESPGPGYGLCSPRTRTRGRTHGLASGYEGIGTVRNTRRSSMADPRPACVLRGEAQRAGLKNAGCDSSACERCTPGCFPYCVFTTHSPTPKPFDRHCTDEELRKILRIGLFPIAE